MNDPVRRRTDLAKLKELQGKMPKALEITGVKGDTPHSISCRIRIPTARNAEYPRVRQEVSDVEIQLPERYPFEKPFVSFKTPIWNPNVYANGQWCFGGWNVTEYLDLFVVRLMKVIALDPTIINPRSPANGDAARWYVQVQERQPELFPTVSILALIAGQEAPKIVWRSIK